jgi:hypothetical protein
MGTCVHFSRSLPSNSWWQTMAGWQVLSRPSAAEGGGRRPAFTGPATQPYSATEVDGWQHRLSRVSQNRAAVQNWPSNDRPGRSGNGSAGSFQVTVERCRRRPRGCGIPSPRAARFGHRGQQLRAYEEGTPRAETMVREALFEGCGWPNDHHVAAGRSAICDPVDAKRSAAGTLQMRNWWGPQG